jgi:hypothetical protein
MKQIGRFNGHLENITDIRYILWPFGYVVVIWYVFIHVLVYCVKKNLATLHR